MSTDSEELIGRSAIISEVKNLFRKYGFSDEQVAQFNVEEKMGVYPDKAAEQLRISHKSLEEAVKPVAKGALARLEKDKAYFTHNPGVVTMATPSNANDFLQRIYYKIRLPGEKIDAWGHFSRDPAVKALREEIDKAINGEFLGKERGSIFHLVQKHEVTRMGHIRAQEAVKELAHTNTQWAPFIYSATKGCQFNVLAKPYDFTPEKTRWAYNFASASDRFDARGCHGSPEATDHLRPNWVMFKDGEHTVVGIACKTKLLSATKYADGHGMDGTAGRPITGFYGFVAKGPVNEIPRRDLDTFKQLYDQVITDELFFNPDPHTVALLRSNTQHGYDFNPPTEAINRSIKGAINTNPNAVRVAAETESEALWHAVAAAEGNQSIILGTKFTEHDFRLSPFKNVTSSTLAAGTHDATAVRATDYLTGIWNDEEFCNKIGVKAVPKPEKDVVEKAAEAAARATKPASQAENVISAERSWVSKALRSESGAIHAGKVAALIGVGTAIVAAGAYMLSHRNKEKERREQKATSAHAKAS